MTIPEPIPICGGKRRFRVGDRVRVLPAAPRQSFSRDSLDGEAPQRRELPSEGPYTIAQVLTATSYRITLPADWDFPLSGVVHASRLELWDQPCGFLGTSPAAAAGSYGSSLGRTHSGSLLPPGFPAAAASASGAPRSTRTPRSHPIPIYAFDFESPDFDDELGELGGLDQPGLLATHDGAEAQQDVVVDVRVGNDRKTAKKACLFRIRWAPSRGRAQGESWEPYCAVAHLAAVRSYLASEEFKAFKGSDPSFASFRTRFPERAPRMVRFAPTAEEEDE
ncbi:hypothetical protein HYH02_003057 [Chlamydomonas schloesseri]|uniref:Chromo domain-containing protein n=1 Tax=Chlamydomonas schloesseri TaxID=2026947 RepID=A0A836B9Q8_9CHLO|nr:hypothetical protein HYH02_003057 [Chlamydomonas schloesseri]|eukprot:KAG2452016.1 hypothetical protein HYH02_003057 [Chlamydomonas schloesseri]